MMRLRRRPERTPPETIIALIDVVFFLLVFFMLIGRMDATSPFEVIPPLGLTGADLPCGGATVAISPDGRQALDGTEMSQSELLAALAPRLQADPALLIRVNGHHATELGAVLPLVAEIEALGARDVVLVVTPNPP
jgi:biopolymer transport protein ExbD